MGTGLRRIRGAFASASLKRRIARLYVGNAVLHPRRIRLGLIEAPSTATDNWTLDTRIRGAFASASLKRRLRLRCPTHFDRHPRRIRLGLIEARFTPARTRRVAVASEAHSPRPH